MHPLRFLNRLTAVVGKGYTHGTVSAISREQLHLEELTDDELAERCAEALAGRFELAKEPPRTLSVRLAKSTLGLIGLSAPQSGLSSLVALGVEAFRRAPADLPPGSALYAQQVRAASALTSRSLVEMETGEGKTYALLPAAFALACRYHRVYVVCASEHLAWRDAHRTLPFWRLLGLPVGLGLESTPDGEWSKRVVYTTLQTMLFKELRESIAPRPPEHPLTYSAVLLDEVDAILLDQGAQRYSLSQPVERRAYDWSAAFELCRSLVPGETIVVDRSDLTASLTEEGERLIRRWLEQDHRPGPSALVLRQMVELAFIALREVREDRDYVVEDERVHPVDRVSGRVNRNQVQPWVPVLEHHLGLEGHPHTIELNSLNPIVFFRKFTHLSGTSGTVLGDSLEFLLTHRLLSLYVKPRFPRTHGRQPDEVVLTREEATRRAAALAVAAVSAGRPVLVGTQTIADAEAVFSAVLEELPEGARPNLLTGRDDSNAARIFEAAGQVGSVLVATQLAGRGIDIRLSEEARANGGMFLIALGHALQARHDRQFLGRAGRHGDPFSALFICSLDDELFEVLGASRLTAFLRNLGYEEGDPITSGMLTKAIGRGQKEYEKRQFLLRRSAEAHSLSEARTYAAAVGWFSRLQSSVEGTDSPSTELSDDYLEWLVKRFVQAFAGAVAATSGEIGGDSAERLVQGMREALGLEPDDPRLRAWEVEGRSGEVAGDILQRRVLEAVREALELRRRLLGVFESWHDLDRMLERHGRSLCDLLDGMEAMLALPDASAPQDGGFAGDGVFDAAEDALDDAVPDDVPGDPEAAWAHWSRTAASAATGIVEAAAALRDQAEAVSAPAWDPATVTAALKPVIDAARELAVAASAEPAMAAVGTRLAAPRRAAQRLRHLAGRSGAAVQVYRIHLRHPRAIAGWCLKWTWLEFLQERSRLRFRYSKQDLWYYDYFRLTARREGKAWRDAERGLPARILAALLRAPFPHRLNDLFVLQDFQAQRESRIATRFEWEATDDALRALPSTGADLATTFVALHERRLPAGFSRSQLLRLLNDFLASHPLHTLSTERSIQEALEAWAVVEVERQVGSEKRKLRRRWLRDFLVFLRKRKLIGPLPGLHDRVRSSGRRLSANLRDLRTLVPLLLGALFVALFTVVAHTGDLLPRSSLGPTASYLDAWTCGGLVAAGNLLAPAVAGVLAAALLSALLQTAGTRRQIGANGLERLVAMTTSLAVAAWMIWQGTGGSGGVDHLLLQSALVVVMMALAILCLRVPLLLSMESSVDLIGLWLAYCALAVVAPHAAGGDTGDGKATAAVLLLAVLAFVWDRLHHVEVELVSSQLLDAADPTSAEDVSTTVRLPGSIGYGPFVVALALTWVLADLGVFRLVASLAPRTELDLALATWSPVAVYVLVVAAMALSILSRRCREDVWRRRLNQRKQELRGIRRDRQLRPFLRRLRRRLLAGELVRVTALLTGTFLVIGVVPAHRAPIPLALLLLTAALLVSRELPATLTQLHHFLAGGGGMTLEMFDIQQVPEPEGTEGFWERLRRVTENRLLQILGVVTTLVAVIEAAIKLWQLLVR